MTYYKLNSPLFMLDDKIIHYITNVLRDVKSIGAIFEKR